MFGAKQRRDSLCLAGRCDQYDDTTGYGKMLLNNSRTFDQFVVGNMPTNHENHVHQKVPNAQTKNCNVDNLILLYKSDFQNVNCFEVARD